MKKLTKYTLKFNALFYLSFANSLVFASTGSNVNETSVTTLAQPSSYSSVFFVQYLPQNALDMINRLPGFSFDKGTNDRGFGGNAGNVLIDGARPTSKSGGLSEALRRIPVDQVIRIEIFRGGNSAGETGGHSIVANVIRATGSTSGTWDITNEGNIDAAPLPRFQASLTTELGQWQTSFNTTIAGWPSHRRADISNYDIDRNITSSEKEDYVESQKWANLTGEGSRELAGGKLSLNGYVYSHIWIRDSKQDVYITPNQSQINTNKKLTQDNRNTTIELGADWDKSYEHWKLRLIGLGMLKDVVADNSFTLFNTDQANFTNHDIQDSRKTELVSRITLAKIGDTNFKPEFGFEVANNKLDSSLILFQNDELQMSQDNDKVVVEELRGEIFANFVFQASDVLTLEGGLTAEYSQIEVNSLNSQKQDFSFIKPRISSTYKFNGQAQLSIELARSVGQLNFGDFATSNEAFDGITNTGNSDLMPDKTTELAATYDWSISERGSLKVKVFHQWRKDVLEQVIIGEDVNGTLAYGLGNAGSATFWGINTDINLPLDFLLSNSLLEISHSYQDSDFFDSIINKNRNINNYVPNSLELNFRQDFIEHKLAWGFNYTASTLNTSYRVNEVQILDQAKKFSFFIESTQFFGVKTFLEVNNASEQTRSRLFYQGNRNGSFNGSQEAHRKLKPVVVLKFSGTF
jgi:hypothetical protein